MSELIIVDKNDMTAVANAIRAKGGTNEEMSFPTGMVNTVNGISNSGSNLPVASSAIVDVNFLPETDIDEGVFYRVPVGKCVLSGNVEDGFTVMTVDELPTSCGNDILVYNRGDKGSYFYMNSVIASNYGVPEGWVTLDMIAPVFYDVEYGGVISDISEAEEDKAHLLIRDELYVHKDGNWLRLPYAYEETIVDFDITWDGNIGDRLTLDMSLLGYDEGLYYVKVSDDVVVDGVVGVDDKIFQNGSIRIQYNDGTFSDATVESPGNIFQFDGANVFNYIVVVYDADALCSYLGLPSGFVTNGTYFYLYTEEGSYVSQFKSSRIKTRKIDSEFIDNFKVGWQGTGKNSVIFNDKSNVAHGEYSHAEGYQSTAGSYASHAEGACSNAAGLYSHAEGQFSSAENDAAHAEGCYTFARGYASHSEGYNSSVSGNYSHAEGFNVHASGRSQHVQGEFNIIDPIGNMSDARGKYVHIVGNGTGEHRSNAHTLDWEGNAWFAGDVYVGGTSQDDTKAVKLAKQSEVPILIDTTATYEDVKRLVTNRIPFMVNIGGWLYNYMGSVEFPDDFMGIAYYFAHLWLKDGRIVCKTYYILSNNVWICEGDFLLSPPTMNEIYEEMVKRFAAAENNLQE